MTVPIVLTIHKVTKYFTFCDPIKTDYKNEYDNLNYSFIKNRVQAPLTYFEFIQWMLSNTYVKNKNSFLLLMKQILNYSGTKSEPQESRLELNFQKNTKNCSGKTY